jgi:hypothetical protein
MTILGRLWRRDVMAIRPTGGAGGQALFGDCTAQSHSILREHYWATLPIAGVQRIDGGPDLELRTCPACGSTLAREVAVLPAIR